MHEYECPSCHSRGPHSIVSDDETILVLECVECEEDIDIAWDDVTGVDHAIHTRKKAPAQ